MASFWYCKMAKKVGIRAKQETDSVLLNTFWCLSEGNHSKRFKASKELADILARKQGQEENLCSDVDYCLKRLVRGLSSSRKWARVGYAAALTSLLRRLAVISTSELLEYCNTQLKGSKSESKSERSNRLLGQVLTLHALVQSDKIIQAENEEILNVTKAILDIRREKAPLHQICTLGLVQIISKVEEDVFSTVVWPELKEELSGGWDNCTPDTLLLLLVTAKHQHGQVGKKFLSKKWNHRRILHESNYNALSNVLMMSTSEHPIIHPVAMEVVDLAMCKAERFSEFWEQVCEEKLLKDQVVQRKYLCLEMVRYGLKQASSVTQIETLLSRGVVGTLIRSLGNNKLMLHSTCKQLVHEMEAFVSRCEDGTMQIAVLSALTRGPGTVMFDSICKTRTVATMVHSLNKEAAPVFAETLKALIRGEFLHGFEKPQEPEVVRIWAVQQLCRMVTQDSMAKDPGWRLDILKFAFLHGFFVVKSTADDIAHCLKHKLGNFSLPIRKELQESFFRALNKLATFQNPDQSVSKSQKLYIEMLHDLVQYAKVLLESPDALEPFAKVDEEVREEWRKILTALQNIRHKPETSEKMEETHAFQLLYLHFSLQLFSDTTGSLEALQDLHICYKKAFQKKRRQSLRNKTESDEPEWIEVITELALSLLSQQSHLVRVVVINVFGMLCPHMNKNAMQLILDVLKPGLESDEEGPLIFEEDGDGDEEKGEESSSDSDGDGDEEKGEESSSDSDEDDDENDDDLQVQPRLRQHLKTALGQAAVESDEEDSDDLSDDEMILLDGALSKVFSNLKKGKKDAKQNELQVKHFKLRCLDLVLTFIQSSPPTGLMLELILPLLELMEIGARNTSQKELGAKAENCFHHLCKAKKLSADPTVDMNQLPDLFGTLLEYSKKVSIVVPVVKCVASACLFVVRVMLGLKEQTEPIQGKREKQKDEDNKLLGRTHDLLRQAINEFCDKRDSNLNPAFVHILFHSQPALMCPLADDLVEILKRRDVRIFCRTQMCAFLKSMIGKNLIRDAGEEMWKSFVSKLIPLLITIITECTVSEIKPKFICEVLSLLHRVICLTDGAYLQDLVAEPQTLVDHVRTLRNHMQKKADVRRECNKVEQLLTRRFSLGKARADKKLAKKRQAEKKEDENPCKITKLSDRSNEDRSEQDDTLTAPSSSPKQKKKSPKKKKKLQEKQENGSLTNHLNNDDSLDSPENTEKVTLSHKKTKRKKSIGKSSIEVNTSLVTEQNFTEIKTPKVKKSKIHT